jgi:CheY-like chemotaxis protein
VRLLVVPSDAEVVVRVEDDGRGISASLLPFVFDRFRQGESDPGRPRAGLGLGLALVRELVAAHKGTVSAESAGEGRGATFVVRLPSLLPRETGWHEAVRPRREHSGFRGSPPAVLIVDDERDARDMLALMLRTQGARVRHVGSAVEAFDAMLEERPDVLLADIGMAEEDGYSLIRRWRSQEVGAGGRRVAAIAVTAYASPTDRGRALAAGFDWHVAKPIDADELVRIISTLRTER